MADPFETDITASPVPPADPIEEDGIYVIEVEASKSFNRSYNPLEGWARWFIDEHGYRWVKFHVKKDGFVYDMVIPSDRVVHVMYDKGRYENWLNEREEDE